MPGTQSVSGSRQLSQTAIPSGSRADWPVPNFKIFGINPKIFDINPKFLDTNPKVKPKI